MAELLFELGPRGWAKREARRLVEAGGGDVEAYEVALALCAELRDRGLAGNASFIRFDRKPPAVTYDVATMEYALTNGICPFGLDPEDVP